MSNSSLKLKTLGTATIVLGLLTIASIVKLILVGGQNESLPESLPLLALAFITGCGFILTGAWYESERYKESGK